MFYFDKTGFHHVIQGNGITEHYEKVSNFKLNIQPSSAETTAMVNGVYGQTFTSFTTYSGLKIGDLITISGTTTTSGYSYKVKGVRDNNYGLIRHFEVVITLPEV